jgi:hypothetical protein
MSSLHCNTEAHSVDAKRPAALDPRDCLLCHSMIVPMDNIANGCLIDRFFVEPQCWIISCFCVFVDRLGDSNVFVCLHMCSTAVRYAHMSVKVSHVSVEAIFRQGAKSLNYRRASSWRK